MLLERAEIEAVVTLLDHECMGYSDEAASVGVLLSLLRKLLRENPDVYVFEVAPLRGATTRRST